MFICLRMVHALYVVDGNMDGYGIVKRWLRPLKWNPEPPMTDVHFVWCNGGKIWQKMRRKLHNSEWIRHCRLTEGRRQLIEGRHRWSRAPRNWNPYPELRPKDARSIEQYSGCSQVFQLKDARSMVSWPSIIQSCSQVFRPKELWLHFSRLKGHCWSMDSELQSTKGSGPQCPL